MALQKDFPLKKIRFFTLFFFFLTFPFIVSAGTINLTTYYPAPFGVYKVLTLSPSRNVDKDCHIGELYVDAKNNFLNLCSDNNLKKSKSKNKGEWMALAPLSIVAAMDKRLTQRVRVLEDDFLDFQDFVDESLELIQEELDNKDAEVEELKLGIAESRKRQQRSASILKKMENNVVDLEKLHKHNVDLVERLKRMKRR